MTAHQRQFYIDGEWVSPAEPKPFEVINPANGETVGCISLGSKADVDRAVAAARRAFPAYSNTSRDDRVALLKRIIEIWEARAGDLASAMTIEMGSPITFSRQVQVTNALGQIKATLEVLQSYDFESHIGQALIRREAIGVCGLITPWNWPLNQVTCKLAPALAAGCTVVLKPSEVAPLSSILLAEILDEAGVPKGVFNLVNGDGVTVGDAIARHRDVDMVSFTGSTRAGIEISQAAAPSIKRVTLELGGKSAQVILPDADLEASVSFGVARCFTNTGQSCIAPTRMLVHSSQADEAVEIAKRSAERVNVGDPQDPQTGMGPLASKAQFEKVQSLIEKGIAEGAVLVAGGPGKPAGLDQGWFVRPTVFANVKPEMAIATQEIFGPVLSIMSYESDQDAIEIANNTDYGLAGYVHSGNPERARHVADRIRAGRIFVNNPPSDLHSPFGGYKHSGNGREQGVFGLEEYLEVKAVLGH